MMAVFALSLVAGCLLPRGIVVRAAHMTPVNDVQYARYRELTPITQRASANKPDFIDRRLDALALQWLWIVPTRLRVLFGDFGWVLATTTVIAVVARQPQRILGEYTLVRRAVSDRPRARAPGVAVVLAGSACFVAPVPQPPVVVAVVVLATIAIAGHRWRRAGV